ncbi:conserved hypothetical protein [Ricinus communis]|uniref:Uncharacterized protein n=1 Tax=Ricinus communis TaxID=3988 RepID=B9RV17_RICCO|nr:conserved hypothetical protein [Ricinus communis]
MTRPHDHRAYIVTSKRPSSNPMRCITAWIGGWLVDGVAKVARVVAWIGSRLIDGVARVARVVAWIVARMARVAWVRAAFCSHSQCVLNSLSSSLSHALHLLPSLPSNIIRTGIRVIT